MLVTVHKDGKISTEVDGIKGPSCTDQIDQFVQGLGNEILSAELKPEHDDVLQELE
jgi:hypothetical protein